MYMYVRPAGLVVGLVAHFVTALIMHHEIAELAITKPDMSSFAISDCNPHSPNTCDKMH